MLRVLYSTSKRATMDKRSKVNLIFGTLSMTIDLLCYTYLASIMILALRVIEKSTS